MYTNFGGCGYFSFGDIATFKNGQFSLSDHGLYIVHGHQNRNRLKKFMQIGVDVTCLYIDFGGHGLYGFRDTATFKNGQISLSDNGL